MKKKIFLYILVICSLFFAVKNETLGASGEIIQTPPEKSIVEMNSSIKELEKEKVELDGKWDTFKSQYQGISGFIKENLTLREAFEIEEITYIYNSKKKTLELQLVEKLKKLESVEEIRGQLRELKKDFYKDIATYVQPERLDDFLEYIKGDIELNEKNKEIKEELYKEKVVLQERVDGIKEKIQEHQEIINQRIEKLIREKLSEKIRLLKENPKYQKLNQKGKVLLFTKTLEKTTGKKQELMLIENKTSVIEKKIELYKIVEEKLQEEITVLNQQ